MQIKHYPVILIIGIIYSCVSKKEEGPIVSDATLFSMAQTVTSFSYYKDKKDTLASDPASDHTSFVRIRFNPKARSVMNDSISRLVASSFPDESMVVKEVYNNPGGPLQYYVIMYKLSNAANNGSGWIWSKMDGSGNPIYSSANKGDACVGCHSSGINTDLIRTFALH